MIDTDIVSESRQAHRPNQGVRRFFADAQVTGVALFLSVITVSELRRGIELLRHRNDVVQARLLERWLAVVLRDFRDRVLDFTTDKAQVWGRLRVPRL